MAKIILVCHEKDWDKAIKKALSSIKQEKTILLVMDDGVKRCLACEPDLFRLLHQFILEGGKALVCKKSLKAFSISVSRPPEIFERIDNGKTFLKRIAKQNFQTIRISD